jgi:K+-sensing histidine kinase KdpD
MAHSDRRLPPRLAESIETMLDESRKMAELVQQFLDFSSRAMIHPQPLDLATLTEDVVETLHPELSPNVRVIVEKGLDRYVVAADAGCVRQVLTNLAVNARDAMPEGGELRFELSRLRTAKHDTPPVTHMAPGAWVSVAVSDTGTGMTKAVEERLPNPAQSEPPDLGQERRMWESVQADFGRCETASQVWREVLEGILSRLSAQGYRLNRLPIDKPIRVRTISALPSEPQN